MKTFIAIALAYAPRFLGRRLSRPIHYCLTFDEEVGCLGVPHLIDFLSRQPVKPVACIVGEPTEMKVVVGHKSKLSIRCRVRGLEAHSSLAPRAVNAVEAAAKVIARLSEMAAAKAKDGPFDEDYDVPHTTVHCGLVRGGTALNIVPADCFFEFEFRCLPADDGEAMLAEIQAYAHQEIEPAMRAIDPDSGFSWEEMSKIPPLDLALDSEVITLVKSLAEANATSKVAFGTEAGLFHDGGIPAVICGPGSIKQAHKPDEFIALEQIGLCERFMGRLLDRVSAA
jgi:acetylornithine deacetylase